MALKVLKGRTANDKRKREEANFEFPPKFCLPRVIEN